MKIFQIINKITYADFSSHSSIANIPDKTYPETVMEQLVEAPDHVFLGWAYINNEFVQPVTPEGFAYDEKTGTYYSTAIEALAQIQHTTWGKTHGAVDSGVITEETFKLITGEDYIPHEEPII